MTPAIRLATTTDAPGIGAIYTPIVRETAISFELEPPSPSIIAGRIEATAASGFPWLVCDDSGRILGYAYAGRYRERPAYRWSVEVSVYVAADARGRGIGQALYASLFRLLALQGYRTVFAGTALPNPASVRLHEMMEFQPVGTYHAVGFKMGVWHDVLWWERRLGSRSDPPSEPLSLADVQQNPTWRDAIAMGENRIRYD
ncbi:MAG TPA: arsinothricin resistance N-acetyltransferase ArsN1 family B [Longimicrobiaceae bacterium]|nr:arsinothricin resistance N-acetyltransferase ArsN1 family B [Longimicrobiaceae bacterium]